MDDLIQNNINLYIMDFTQFIKDNDPKGIAIRTHRQDAPHLTDPILRRYHIIRLSTNACGLFLGTWSLRLLAQNISGHKLHRLSPWLELTLSGAYLAFMLHQKFYLQVNRNSIARSKVMKAYNQQHYGDSQFWH